MRAGELQPKRGDGLLLEVEHPPKLALRRPCLFELLPQPSILLFEPLDHFGQRHASVCIGHIAEGCRGLHRADAA